MGSKGSSTSTKTTSPPPYLNAAYMNILGQAQNLASQPYTPYTGQLTAGLTDEQQQAISGLANNQSAYQPYFNQASQSLGNVTSVTPTAYSAEEIAKYQSPYTQQVVDATTAQLQKTFGQQQNALVGNAISSGAWGGNRASVAQGTLAGNQADTLANTVANLYNQSFTNAQNQFNTANQAQMNAAQTNNANAMNLGSLYAGLGTGVTNNSIAANNALLGAGQTEQNTNQNDLNAQYQQFLNEQGWGQNQLTWLANLATGLGGVAGGTTTGTTPNSGNGLSSILGGALALASRIPGLSDERMKRDIEPVGELYDGQPIYRFKYLGDPTPRIGLMAQDVEEVAPEAVGSLGGLKTVDYDRATDEAAQIGRDQYADGGYVPQVAGLGQVVSPLIVGLQMPQVQAPRGGLNAPDVGESGGGGSGLGGFGGLGVDRDTVDAGLGSLKRLLGGNGATTEAIAKASPLDAISFGLKFADGGAVDDEGMPLIFGPTPEAEPLIFGPDPEPAPGLVPSLPQQLAPSQEGTAVAGLGRLPRGFRTNNPGNIKDGPFARSLPGYKGSDGVNAIFETPQAGLGAMNTLLDSYGRRGLNTVSGILNRWAPPNADNNDTGGYVNYVSKRLGVDPNAPLTPEARAQLPAAMAYFENGREFPMDGNPLAVADASTGRITPRAAPSSAGSDEAEIPANAMAAQGVAPDQTRGLLGLTDADRDALFATGLAIMAGGSRNAGENIGQGALFGLTAYQNRQDAARRAQYEAAKLQRELRNDARKADYDERKLKLEEQKANQTYRPITQAERAAYGIAPDDTRPWQVGPENKLFLPGGNATNVTVNSGLENAFDSEGGKRQAQRFDDIIQQGMSANQTIGDLQNLKDIGSRISTGKTAEIQAALGPYIDALGVKVDGLDDMQAYKAIVARLAPQMRVAGSGATSDYDARMFLEALPGLGKTPGGNEIISNTMEALARHKIAAAEIASKAISKEIKPEDAQKQIQALPNPYALWKEWKGSAPTQKSTQAPASAGPPKITSQNDYARLPSGTRYVAPDGNVRIKP